MVGQNVLLELKTQRPHLGSDGFLELCIPLDSKVEHRLLVFVLKQAMDYQRARPTVEQ
jgi:hypothetical protein